MLLPKFDFHEPASIDEACEIMATYGAKAKLLAGGTDLMVNMKKKILTPEHLVCLSRISAMHGIEQKGDQIIIGGRYTVAELTVDTLVEEKLGALRSGAKALGSPLVRNRATIGGNIGSARPAADLPPSLIAYGATAMLQSRRGKRELSLGDFFKGPGFTEIDVDEILTEIRVPVPRQGEGAGYINLGVRKAQDCNIVNVASFIALDKKDGCVTKARIVMGSVGPTPIRAATAEAVLVGQRPDERLFLQAGEAARQDCTPIDDFRGAASYRKAMVGVLTKRTLDIAHRRAVGA
jgi:CO/xanthine dehydrogenase FAD-binding subunit